MPTPRFTSDNFSPSRMVLLRYPRRPNRDSPHIGTDTGRVLPCLINVYLFRHRNHSFLCAAYSIAPFGRVAVLHIQRSRVVWILSCHSNVKQRFHVASKSSRIMAGELLVHPRFMRRVTPILRGSMYVGNVAALPTQADGIPAFQP